MALMFALAIHILVIAIANYQGWFTASTETKAIQQPELDITIIAPKSRINHNEPAEPEIIDDKKTPLTSDSVQQTKAPTFKQSETNETPHSQEKTDKNLIHHDTSQPLQNSVLIEKPDSDVTTKESLLDLSKISISPDIDEAIIERVFSKELQKKIEVSKQVQKTYLKGVKEKINFPITIDADGTRYVNIKGVCWRLPKEGSNDSWAIVFDGCGLKDKAFHFELNINPSILTHELLGPDSPFTLDK